MGSGAVIWRMIQARMDLALRLMLGGRHRLPTGEFAQRILGAGAKRARRLREGCMIRSSLRGLSVLALSFAVGASQAAELPELGDRSSGLVSPATERQLAQIALKQIRSSVDTIADPILKYYVKVNVHRLAEFSGISEPALTTVLIDNPQINAFAVPGGIVGINLGLFLYGHDESEYSAVVAHELAHLGQRHYARSVEEQRAMTPWMLAGLLASLAIAAGGGGEAGMAALLGTQAYAQDKALRFSRSREQEADRIGLNTLERAGLDPDGMGRMFERMQTAFRFVDKPPEFLLTHPLTDARITDARNQAERFDGRTVEPSLDYQFMRARARIHYADSPRRAVADARSLRGGGDADTYALAVALSRADHHEEAVETARRLHQAHPHSLLMAASLAEILIAAERLDEALVLLSNRLRINPDNEPLTYLKAEALDSADRHAEAAELLWRHARVNTDDVDVWHLLAETAGLAGDTMGVHRARAEYFALFGAYRQAIQHIEYARRLVDTDDRPLGARLDQRLLDLRTEYEAAREQSGPRPG